MPTFWGPSNVFVIESSDGALHGLVLHLSIVVEERERDGDIERVVFERSRTSLSTLKCQHEINPTSWSLRLKAYNLSKQTSARKTLNLKPQR